MKNIAILATLLFSSMCIRSIAQIPNGDFELWNDSLPANWITCGQNVSKNMSTESVSGDAYFGVKALQCKNVKIFNTATTFYIMPGWIEQKNVATSGVPICLSGAYKIYNNTNDTLFAILTLKTGSNVIGMASFSATGNAANYTSFCVTPTISGQASADNFDVYVGFNKKNLHPSASVNTYFLIDAMEVNRLSTISETRNTQLVNLFLDDSNSEIVIKGKADSDSEIYGIKVFDVNGRILFADDRVSLPHRIPINSFTQGLHLIQVSNLYGSIENFKYLSEGK
jgi:hypothetical protein